MEYKINVTISEDDYKSFIFDNIFQKKIGIIFAICAFLLVLILEIIDFILTKKITNYMYTILFITIFFIFLMFLLSTRLGKLYKSDALLHEGYLITISENKIKVETTRGTVSYKNEDFIKIIYGKKVFALYISQQKAVVVPRHCLASKEEETEFEEFLKQNFVKKEK